MKEGFRKMSFDISEENYDYLVNMSKHTNIKLSPLLNNILNGLRVNGTDIATSAKKEYMIDEKIKLIEKTIQEQSLFLAELKDFKRTISSTN